jgi:hypothetical protein
MLIIIIIKWNYNEKMQYKSFFLITYKVKLKNKKKLLL